MMKEKIEQAVMNLCDLISAHKTAGGQIDENVACVASATVQLAQIARDSTDQHKKETAVAAAVGSEIENNDAIDVSEDFATKRRVYLTAREQAIDEITVRQTARENLANLFVEEVCRNGFTFRDVETIQRMIGIRLERVRITHA